MGVATCPDCHGPVDVVEFHGAGIRCGCGHTHLPNTPAPPLPPRDVHADLVGLLLVLRTNRVTTYRAGQVEITLSPESWATVPASVSMTQPPNDGPEMCTCGHALHDHAQAGCTLGCDLDTCGLPGQEKAA